MNWINLNTTTLDSPEFIGAEPVERATWLCLLRYCAGQENGGRIEGARLWKDRKWQQVVRVTEQEIATACALWHWDGEDLVVAFYPEEKEAEVKRRRRIASDAGVKSSEVRSVTGAGGRKKKVVPAEPPAEASIDGSIDGHQDGSIDGQICGPLMAPLRLDSRSTEREGERKEKEKEKGSTPLGPPGGFEGVLPGKWETITDRQAKFRKVFRNNPAMDRIGTWFNRRPGTPWALAEGIALCRLAPEADDLELLEPYYLAEIPKEADRRRQDLMNLLDHWSSELDRARIWKAGALSS